MSERQLDDAFPEEASAIVYGAEDEGAAPEEPGEVLSERCIAVIGDAIRTMVAHRPAEWEQVDMWVQQYSDSHRALHARLVEAEQDWAHDWGVLLENEVELQEQLAETRGELQETQKALREVVKIARRALTAPQEQDGDGR